MELEKYSMGIGERLFGFECAAQLRALQKAAFDGLHIAPVWNKSKREHKLSGTAPEAARKAADEAVRTCHWNSSYYIDADHINLSTVDAFLSSHNFFTIDIADFIGKPMNGRPTAPFFTAMAKYKGQIEVPGMQTPIQITDFTIEDFSQKYLCAIMEAGNTYRRIAENKGADNFVTEISIDEAQNPQTPAEMMLFLAAIALEGIPLQTIAPKFTGAFLKGIDYVGDLQRFAREFHDDLAIVAFAVNHFNLPRNLKLSIHTGSDKFSLYPIMHRAIKSVDAGIHLKTAGTTWLEEVAGFAASGGGGLTLAKEIYQISYERCDELCQPYLAVIDIDRSKLPPPAKVASWSSEEFVHVLQHNQSRASYNPHFRQLVHIGFRIAAEMGPRFTDMLGECRSVIEANVTENLYERHIQPLFFGSKEK